MICLIYLAVLHTLELTLFALTVSDQSYRADSLCFTTCAIRNVKFSLIKLPKNAHVSETFVVVKKKSRVETSAVMLQLTAMCSGKLVLGNKKIMPDKLSCIH